MPLIRTEKPRKSLEKEGRIQLAISAINKGEISSIREAANIFSVPRSTLSDRLQGRTARVDRRANSHKLPKNEEETLIKWILDLDKRGLPP
jgi:predicted HTH domain antitoxin